MKVWKLGFSFRGQCRMEEGSLDPLFFREEMDVL
jgi:hypothetical protein